MLDVVAFVLVVGGIFGAVWLLDRLDARPKAFLPERVRWAICILLALGGNAWAIFGGTGASWAFALLLTAPLFTMILRRSGSSFNSGPGDGGTGFYGGP